MLYKASKFHDEWMEIAWTTRSNIAQLGLSTFPIFRDSPSNMLSNYSKSGSKSENSFGTNSACVEILFGKRLFIIKSKLDRVMP